MTKKKKKDPELLHMQLSVIWEIPLWTTIQNIFFLFFFLFS